MSLISQLFKILTDLENKLAGECLSGEKLVSFMDRIYKRKDFTIFFASWDRICHCLV
jgi:hypothetical protein